MKALVKKKSERGLWLDDVPEPAIGINDVLIKIDRTGICGTDLHIYKWDAWAQKTIPVPMVVGHEFVGEIVEVSEVATRKFTIGRPSWVRRTSGSAPRLPTMITLLTLPAMMLLRLATHYCGFAGSRRRRLRARPPQARPLTDYPP